jgi:hypothetical protein
MPTKRGRFEKSKGEPILHQIDLKNGERWNGHWLGTLQGGGETVGPGEEVSKIIGKWKKFTIPMVPIHTPFIPNVYSFFLIFLIHG